MNTAKHDLQLEKVRNRRYENSIGRHKKKSLEKPPEVSKGDIGSAAKGDANMGYITMKNGLDESLMNRELLTRMVALSEMMKSLQDENKFLKSENKGLFMI